MSARSGNHRRRADGRRRNRSSKTGRTQIAYLKERDGRKCRGCGTRHGLTRDHVIPWARGGNSTVDNLILLCLTCNVLKDDLLPHEPGWPPQLEHLRLELLPLVDQVLAA